MHLVAPSKINLFDSTWNSNLTKQLHVRKISFTKLMSFSSLSCIYIFFRPYNYSTKGWQDFIIYSCLLGTKKKAPVSCWMKYKAFVVNVWNLSGMSGTNSFPDSIGNITKYSQLFSKETNNHFTIGYKLANKGNRGYYVI